MDATIHPPVLLPHEVSGPLRHVLLAVKAHHTEAALVSLIRYLDPDGYVVSLQNGLEEPKVAALAGADRTIGAFLTFGGHYRAPGDVVFGGPGTFRVGELDGRITERLLALRDALGAVQEVEVTANIAGYLWAKLALGAIRRVRSQRVRLRCAGGSAWCAGNVGGTAPLSEPTRGPACGGTLPSTDGRPKWISRSVSWSIWRPRTEWPCRGRRHCYAWCMRQKPRHGHLAMLISTRWSRSAARPLVIDRPRWCCCRLPGPPQLCIRRDHGRTTCNRLSSGNQSQG
jgi:hypothetical protein